MVSGVKTVAGGRHVGGRALRVASLLIAGSPYVASRALEAGREISGEVWSSIAAPQQALGEVHDTAGSRQEQDQQGARHWLIIPFERHPSKPCAAPDRHTYYC